MNQQDARQIAREIAEQTCEDIVTTCEGEPEAIGKVLRALIVALEKEAANYPS